MLVSNAQMSFGSGLSGFLLQDLTRIPDTLLLVRIRLAQTTDVGGHLSDKLAVYAGYRNVRLLVDRDVDARRNIEHHRVRVAEREDHLLALQLRAVADADDVELAFEAVGDARDSIGHQTARQAVELAELRIVGLQLRYQVPIFEREGDAGR